jgi:eukaryotic-like serine/threonine-protein kinase
MNQTPERLAELLRIAQQALARGDAERAGYLDASCGADADVRREVEALLAEQASGDGFLAAPPWQPPPTKLVAGQRLGPYEIQSAIGAGGMGEVYRARDTRLDRTVAIKVLPPAVSADPDRRARFQREAKTIAALNHPHICTLYDVGEYDPAAGAGPAALYLVMEHLAGDTLAARLEKGALPLEQALAIATDVADALSAAHRQGVIHRDLKPGNVMLTKSGAKLLDFGLAKLAGHGEQAAAASLTSVPTETRPLTSEGTIIGTLQYMAPEQVEGKAADARTDLWALGAILYEMLTGKAPFQGASAASLIADIMNAEPPSAATLQPLTPPSVDRLVRRCLAKAPDDRWDSAHDVADELRWMRETSGAMAPRPSRVPRRTLLILAATGGVIAVGVLGSFIAWRLRPLPLGPVVRASIELPAGTRLTGQLHPTRTEFAFSRDGQYLAFSASSPGQSSETMLYLRALDSTDAAPIRGTEGAQQPFFSPDGNWLGFWSKPSDKAKEGMLRKVRRSGGIPTDLLTCDMPMGAFWNEDGTILLGREDAGIQRIPADGGDAQVLTTVDPNRETQHTLPFVLPDGRTVLFTSMPDSFGHRAQLEAVSLGGGTRQVVIQDAADARYLATGHIVFVRQGVLMAATFDMSRLKAGPPVPVVLGVEQALNTVDGSMHSGAGQFSVSGSGSLAYGAGGVEHFLENELVWVSRDGRTETLAGFDHSDVTNQVRLSNDGRRVAFVQQAGPLWLFDVERATSTRVSPPEGAAGAPRWHPDGHRLTFRWSSGGSPKAWQMSVDEGNEALEGLPLASSLGLALSSWSRDGRYLAYVGDGPDTGKDILIYDAQSHKTQPFLQTRSNESYPEFSPDGRWLAYVSDDNNGRREVYLRSFPDASRKTLVSKDGARAPAWSPDGRELFYTSLEPSPKMMKVDVRLHPDVWVGRPQPLFDFTFLTCSPMRGYDLDRNGRFLVTRIKRQPVVGITRINLVHNWFQELKAKVPVTR